MHQDANTSAEDLRGPVVLATTKQSFHPRHFHLLATGLKRAGIPVAVVGQRVPGVEPHGIDVTFLPPRTGRISRMLSAPGVIRRALRLSPSLIQVNSLELLPWGVAARALFGVPVIYDCNEDYASYMLQKQWLPRPLRRPLSKLVAVAEPWLAARLDATIFADRRTPERFERNHKLQLVVHNFPWRSLAQLSAAAGERRYDVTYHGSLPEYHAEAIIETARMLSDRGRRVRWCIAAREYEPAEQEWLRAQVSAAGLEHQFTLLFNVPFEQISSVLTQTRLGFIPLPDTPKFRRNIPRKVFEFMAVGRPAVVSDLPPTRDLIGDVDCCLLVEPGNVRAYADGIDLLLTDPQRADEMGERGKRLILERMHAEHELRPYVEFCRHAALKRGNRRAN